MEGSQGMETNLMNFVEQFFPNQDPQRFKDVLRFWGEDRMVSLMNVVAPEHREQLMNNLVEAVEGLLHMPLFGVAYWLPQAREVLRQAQETVDNLIAQLAQNVPCPTIYIGGVPIVLGQGTTGPLPSSPAAATTVQPGSFTIPPSTNPYPQVSDDDSFSDLPPLSLSFPGEGWIVSSPIVPFSPLLSTSTFMAVNKTLTSAGSASRFVGPTIESLRARLGGVPLSQPMYPRIPSSESGSGSTSPLLLPYFTSAASTTEFGGPSTLAPPGPTTESGALSVESLSVMFSSMVNVLDESRKRMRND